MCIVSQKCNNCVSHKEKGMSECSGYNHDFYDGFQMDTKQSQNQWRIKKMMDVELIENPSPVIIICNLQNLKRNTMCICIYWHERTSL